MELYGNWGRGFHSNDGRGVVSRTDPVPALSQGTGYEAGARYEIGTFRLSGAYWWLNLGSELVFVGDSNAVEPKGGGKRHGYELVAFWRPLDWLALDAVYTGSHARYNDAQDDGGYNIEGSVEKAGEFGFSALKGPWEVSARLRYLGPYPLVPDNSQRAGCRITGQPARRLEGPAPHALWRTAERVQFAGQGHRVLLRQQCGRAGSAGRRGRWSPEPAVGAAHAAGRTLSTNTDPPSGDSGLALITRRITSGRAFR